MNKILKLYIFTALFGSSILLHAKDLNPHKDSYGAWKNTDGSVAEDFLITKQGFDWIAKSPKTCDKQKIVLVSGKQLLRGIKESIDGELTEPHDVRFALNKIQPNKQYIQIQGISICTDGFSSLTLLDKQHALGMIAAPEDGYMDLHK